MKAVRALKKKGILPLEGMRFLVFASVIAGMGLAALPAEAARAGKAPPKPQEAVTTVAAKDPETTSSISSDEDAYCASSRKRLFVEGEGWIVRRVTTCY